MTASRQALVRGFFGLLLLGGAGRIVFLIVPYLHYLYLSAIGWALLLAALVDRASRTFANPRPRAILLAAAVCLLVVDGVGIRLHVRPWISAAALRDQVERSAAETPCSATAASRRALKPAPVHAPVAGTASGWCR